MEQSKIIYLIISFLFAFISCSKEDSALNNNSEYFMSFEINGTKILYTEILKAEPTYIPSQGVYGISIAGANFTGPNTDEDFGIMLIDNKEISTGTYTQKEVVGSILSEAFISYIKSGQGYSSVYPSLSNVTKATVTITEITSIYIAGSFSGALVTSSGDYNSITHTIKNGKFKIKLSETVINEQENKDYYLNFDANKVNTSFLSDYTNISFKESSNFIYIAAISGIKLNGEVISITISDTEPIIIGKTYTEELNTATYLSRASITYTKSSINYFSVALLSTVPKARITFTEITSTYVSGAFSAELVTQNEPNNIAQTIENGEFKIKIIN